MSFVKRANRLIRQGDILSYTLIHAMISSLGLNSKRSSLAAFHSIVNASNRQKQQMSATFDIAQYELSLSDSLSYLRAEIERYHPAKLPQLSDTVQHFTSARLFPSKESRKSMRAVLVTLLNACSDAIMEQKLSQSIAEARDFLSALDALAYRLSFPDITSQAFRASHKTSILLVSGFLPSVTHAGGLRIYDIYSYVREFFPETRIELFSRIIPHLDGDSPLESISTLFDAIYISPNDDLSFNNFLSLRNKTLAPFYDVVDIQFWNSSISPAEYRLLARKLVFTPMESHIRNLAITFDKYITHGPEERIGSLSLVDLIKLCREEIAVATHVDEVVTVSYADKISLRRVLGDKPVTALETCISSTIENEPTGMVDPSSRFFNRCVVYLAFFGSQTNVDALEWYLRNVHPKLLSLEAYKFLIIGSGDISSVSHLFDSHTIYIGPFENMADALSLASVGISPVLSGGGFRGKINQYSFFSIPTVAHPNAIKGLPYKHRESILIGKTPEEYAELIREVLEDKALYDRLSLRAKSIVKKRYSWISKRNKLQSIYDVREIRVAVQERPFVSIIVPSYMHACFLQQRIASIFEQRYDNYELIVIDDCSTDGSQQILADLSSEHNFRYIANTRNSGSTFAGWYKGLEIASGDLIWICESDDFAHKDFLFTSIDKLVKDPTLAFFYSASTYINDAGITIGSTFDYHSQNWGVNRWNRDFSSSGSHEFKFYQLSGQTVPNMSSCVVRRHAFELALKQDLRPFRLCGDWLFIGMLMKYGNVAYSANPLNFFRKHQQTQTAQTPLAKSIAEYLYVKYLFFRECEATDLTLAKASLVLDCHRSIHEDVVFFDIYRELARLAGSYELTDYILTTLWKLMQSDSGIVGDLFDRYINARLALYS